MSQPCKTCKRYKQPRLAIDGIVFNQGQVLLVRRALKEEAFYNSWALPGGFVDYGESMEKAAVREVWEETGLKTSIRQLIGVYSDPLRDPRGHTVSVAYTLYVESGELKISSETKEVKWFDINNLPKLAFDHTQIIEDFRRSNKHVSKYKGWNLNKKLVFCSQSRFYMFASEQICKFVTDQNCVPINSFTNFGYFLYELVPRDSISENINNIINICHELWVFGPITNGVDLEIKMCRELGKPIRFFDFSEDKTPCRITEVDEQYLREKKW